MKRNLITIAKFALSIAILTYLFNKASQNDQFDTLFASEKNWWWLGIGLMSCLTAQLIGFLRWRIMVRALDLPFRILDAIQIGFIGLFFSLWAFGPIGGDTLKAFYVAREFPQRKPEAIASVVADRMIGLLTMLLVASISFLLFDTTELNITHPNKLASVRLICQIIMSLTIVGFAVFAVLFSVPRISKQKWVRRLMKTPRLGTVLKKIIAVVALYRSRPAAILLSFLLSFGVNISFLISIFAIANGLFDHNPSFANHFVIEPITMVSNALPLPGGLGGMEFALDFLYQAFAVDHGVVVAFAFRFSLLLVSAIGAIIWFSKRRQVENLSSE